MNVIFAGCAAVVVYNLMEMAIKIIYGKNLQIKKQLDNLQRQHLMEFIGQSRTRSGLRRKSKLKVPEKIRAVLISSGVPLRADEFIKLWAAVTIIPGVLSAVFGQSIGNTFFFVLLGVAIPPLYLVFLKKRRMEKFNQQLGDALMILSNSLRAGFTFEQSLASLAKDLPDPLGTEFMQVVRELEMGGSLEKSLQSVADHMSSRDMQLLNTAVLIQRQVGGSLSDIIDSIAVTIRDRIVIKRTVKTLTSQGRISGQVIGALPIFLLVSISLINPDYMRPVYTTPFGFALLAVCMFLEVLGFIVIRKIVNIKV